MLPTLETDRLSLNEVTLEDGPHLQAYQSRPEQFEHQAVEPADFADGTERVRMYFEHRGPDDQRRIFDFVARLKANGQIIGHVGLQRSHPVIGHLGFGVDSNHAGQGYATEMASRLMTFAFEEVGLNRLVADIAISNLASIKVAEKLGMIREGINRECIFAQGRWWTEAQYAMLASEYRALATRQAA